jgi:magnesium transporter
MFRAMCFQDGVIRTDITLEEIKASLPNTNILMWVDFEDTLPEEDEPILRDIFGFHPLAIEDALQQSHVPKLDDWELYLYIVLHSIAYDKNNGGVVDTLELDIFLGKNYIVTHHDVNIPAVDRIWATTIREQRHIKNGVDRLLYRLTEEVVLSYLPIVEELDEAIDKAEDQVFDNPTPHTLEQIFNLKRSIVHLRRVIGPQREVLNKLARDDFDVIEPRTRIYFRDVYDHLVRLYDIIESSRDLVGGTLDSYLSVINNRMNDIMKTLTVITTLFMPLTFLTGFFGMNFFAPGPELSIWTHRVVFFLMVVLMVSIPATMMLWLRRKGWL